MAITKMTDNLNIIQSLPDNPALEADELKRKFDEGGNAIKTYINDILTKEIDALVKEIKDDVSNQIIEDNKKKYYIGKIIMDTKNVNPSTYLGFGVWQLWGTGRVPVGVDTTQEEFNEVEKEGGEKTHTLTSSELPDHKHVFSNGKGNYVYPTVDRSNTTNWGASFSSSSDYKIAPADEQKMEGTSGKSHNNLQPYITCYMWKRIS